MKPRLAVLDMIGTTVRAGTEVADSFRESFAHAGIEISDAEIDAVRGRSKQEAVVELLNRHAPATDDAPARAADIHTSFISLLRGRYETTSREVPGARTTIEYLAARDVAVVLATGLDRATADRVVRSVGWEGLPIRGLITGEDVQAGRPAPDLIHGAMALAGVDDPGSVLVVGDTVSDLESAARARVGWGVGVLSGAHARERLESRPYTVILESIAHVPEWLTSHEAIVP